MSWRVYRSSLFGMENEAELLARTNSLDKAIQLVEEKCREAHKDSPFEYFPLDQYLRHGDPRLRKIYDNVFFSITDDYKPLVYIAVTGGVYTYFALKEEM